MLDLDSYIERCNDTCVVYFKNVAVRTKTPKSD